MEAWPAVVENIATMLCATVLSIFAIWWSGSNWGLLALLLLLNLKIVSPELQAACDAYWRAETIEEQRVAYRRMRELGMTMTFEESYEEFLARDVNNACVSREAWERCLGPESPFARFETARAKELGERVYVGPDGIGKTGAELWPPHGNPRPRPL